MKEQTKQVPEVSTLYKFKKLFTSNTDLSFISEQVLYLVDKKYKNNDINRFVSFFLNLIFNPTQNKAVLMFNKQLFDLSNENLLIFLDPSMKDNIIDILDTIKLELSTAYLIQYELVDLYLSNKSIDFKVFVTFDKNFD